MLFFAFMSFLLNLGLALNEIWVKKLYLHRKALPWCVDLSLHQMLDDFLQVQLALVTKTEKIWNYVEQV